ncbi:MAG: hypothetical protein AAF802_18990 [Planctomycetota bacterium]
MTSLFLDTKTGALWRMDVGGEWTPIDSPVKTATHPADTVVAKKLTLSVPKDGIKMPMMQRETRPVPGSSNRLWVKIGDITAGQVFVEVISSNGQRLVERTSLKEEEFLSFKMGEQKFYLQVTEMVNHLLSRDLCTVRISTMKPKPSQKLPTEQDESTDTDSNIEQKSTIGTSQ